MMSVVPFFVADRPMSLRIIKGLPLSEFSNVRIGIMAHANTSQSFQHILNDYPCDDKNYCDAVKGPCQHPENTSDCPVRQHILSHTVKMCDSGIFTREGATLTYKELFEAYHRMGVSYGVMIDVFRDPQATLDSAREALKEYEIFKSNILSSEQQNVFFHLVGVAQGKTVEEYISNYADLRALGISHIAVGGLLRKVEKTVRYTQVRDEDFMYQVLDILREKYPDDWLFALGCFNPSRLDRFKGLHVWGDYKGWIFQYEKRNESLETHIEMFSKEFLQNIPDQKNNKYVLTLQQIIATRVELKEQQGVAFHQLNEGRRSLKAMLRMLYTELQLQIPELALQMEYLLTRSILNDRDEKIVCIALEQLGKSDTEGSSILENIYQNREMKTQVENYEILLNKTNDKLVLQIAEYKKENVLEAASLEDSSRFIKELIEETERVHRFGQVRTKIKQNILERLP